MRCLLCVSMLLAPAPCPPRAPLCRTGLRRPHPRAGGWGAAPPGRRCDAGTCRRCGGSGAACASAAWACAPPLPKDRQGCRCRVTALARVQQASHGAWWPWWSLLLRALLCCSLTHVRGTHPAFPLPTGGACVDWPAASAAADHGFPGSRDRRRCVCSRRARGARGCFGAGRAADCRQLAAAPASPRRRRWRRHRQRAG